MQFLTTVPILLLLVLQSTNYTHGYWIYNGNVTTNTNTNTNTNTYMRSLLPTRQTNVTDRLTDVFRIRDIPPELDIWIRENYPQYRNLSSLPTTVLDELERKFHIPQSNTTFIPAPEDTPKDGDGGDGSAWIRWGTAENVLLLVTCTLSGVLAISLCFFAFRRRHHGDEEAENKFDEVEFRGTSSRPVSSGPGTPVSTIRTMEIDCQ